MNTFVKYCYLTTCCTGTVGEVGWITLSSGWN